MNAALLEKNHLPEVAALEALCFHSPWSEKTLEHLLDEKNLGVVALEDGKVIAYAGLVTALDEGEITNVATHPDHRNRGAARAVLGLLLTEAKARGIARITLEVRQSNTPARTLYESLGFTLCGTRKGFYSHPREDALIMEKIID